MVAAASFALFGLARLAHASKEDVERLTMPLGWLAGCGVYVLFFAAFESGPGQATPGKRALGIFVGDHDGERLGLGHALLRTGAKFAWGALAGLVVLALLGLDPRSAEALRRLLTDPLALGAWLAGTAFGHLMAAWTRDRQAFHDVITGSCVFRR